MPADPIRAPRVAGPLRSNRNFLALYLSGVISLSGSLIGNVAILFLTFTATGSALAIAYVGLAVTIPQVAFALVGGTLADRVDRRRLMVASDLVRSAAFFAVTLLTYHFGYQLASILAVAAVSGAFTSMFNPAQQSFLPRVVAPDQLTSANGAIQSSLSIVGFLATAVGGSLVAFAGPIPALGYNGLTFLGSAACVLSIRAAAAEPAGTPGKPPRPSFAADLRGGFAYLASQPGLLAITLSALFVNFFLTLPYLFVVVYSVRVLHGSALVYGAILASAAAGTAVGAPLVHRFRRVLLPNAGKVWQLHALLFGPAILLLVVLPGLASALVGMFVVGWLIGVGGTTWLSAAQTVVPPEMQGRYFGVDALGSFAILPLASVLGGLFIDAYGVLGMFAIAGGGGVLTGLAFLPVRALWRFGTAREASARPP